MSTNEEVQLVVFRVGGHEFGLNIFDVERVLRYEKPAPLPQAPDFLEGIMEYEDTAIPVIDLRKRLNVDASVRDDTRTMILEWEQGRIAVVVDAVIELLRAPVDEIVPPPPIVRGLAAEYISGIFVRDGRTIVILSVPKILSSTERLALEKATDN
ncbi:MAG: chemotaxis protein CheW, partial [Gemmatimonadales bacterium]